MPVTSVATSVVQHIVKLTFPDFKGKEVFLHTTNQTSYHNTLWSEGSKEEYCVLTLATFKVKLIPTALFGQKSWQDEVHPIDSGTIVVNLGRRPKYNVLTLHGSEEDLKQFIPKKIEVELTDMEKKILRIIKENNAKGREWQLNYQNISKSTYEQVKASLASKGLLDKRGVITTEAKNLVSSWV